MRTDIILDETAIIIDEFTLNLNRAKTTSASVENREKIMRDRHFIMNVLVAAVALGACDLSAPGQPMPAPGRSRIERDADSTYRARQPVVYQVERGIERLAKRAPASEFVHELPPSPDLLLDDESSAEPTKAPKGENQNIVFGSDERLLVTNPNDFPNRAVAKILLTYPDGIFSCTGSVIGRRAVLTAGHCVHREGVGWAHSATVIPAFNSGPNPAPFGQSSAIQFFSTSGWTAEYDDDYDLAVIILADELGATTGYMGLAALSDGALNSFGFDLNGYPGDLGGGQNQYHASGSVESYDAELVYLPRHCYQGATWSRSTATPARPAATSYASCVKPGIDPNNLLKLEGMCRGAVG